MSKATLLQQLKEKAVNDPNLPLKKAAHNIVFGEGNPEAEIYFLGEAPGGIEDLTGKPFVGPAGKLLDKLLASISLKREDVFITSVLYFRPPNNRNPHPFEIAAFTPYTDKQIEIIDPEIIVTLGKFSLNKFLPKTKISEVHGQVLKINWKGKEKTLIPQYHPAAGLRSNEVLEKLKKDFRSISSVLSG